MKTGFWISLIAIVIFTFINNERRSLQSAETFFKSFLQNYTQGNYMEAEKELNIALQLFPNNAPYQSHRALLYERMLHQEFNIEIFFNCHTVLNENQLNNIEQAIASYKKALSLNPYDDSYHHNLAWLYFLSKRETEAFDSLKQAITLDNSIPIYHISLGLLYEQSDEIDSALNEYLLAITQSPNILNSQFFEDLQKRNPEYSNNIVPAAIENLEARLKQTNDPISKAKLGKLYLHNGETEKAKYTLEQVIKDLPNLSLPWFNLGYIYELDGKRDIALDCYEKALFLDGTDALPWIHIARIHDSQGRLQEATYSYSKAVECGLYVSSEHAKRGSRIYHAQLSLGDDVIPNGLLTYCNPVVNISELGLKLSDLFTQTGDTEAANYFKNLSEKYANRKKL
jgi:tetratricopeptide (TPR) repeat protein